MNESLTFSREAWDDYQYWQKQDKKTMRRINQLLLDVQRNGHSGIGKPEPLKGDKAGYWSRRINECDRLVYRITDSTIEIRSCKTHYDD